jgi:hypothetical protein
VVGGGDVVVVVVVVGDVVVGGGLVVVVVVDVDVVVDVADVEAPWWSGSRADVRSAAVVDAEDAASGAKLTGR